MTARQIESEKTVRQPGDEKITSGAPASLEALSFDKENHLCCQPQVISRNEEIYMAFFREMPDGFALHETVCDTKGNPVDYLFIDANPAFERLTGLMRDTIIGRTVSELIAEFIAPDWHELVVKNILSGYEQPYDAEGFRKDGTRFKLRIKGKNIPCKGKAVRLTEFRVFTVRKRIEEELLEADWKFRALFEKGPIGVAYHKMIYDEAGKPVDYSFLDANDQYIELTGVDPRGKTVRQAFPGIENDPFDWIGTFGKVARTGETIHFEQNLQTNGRWYDCVGYQYRPDQFVAAFLEITGRKKAELELARLNDQLKAKNKELAQVVYVASHDLRSPLVNIDGYGKELEYSLEELLRTFLAGQLPVEEPTAALRSLTQDMAESLRYIRSSTAQMDAVLNGLLKFSRFGRSALSIKPLDMDRLLANVTDSFQFLVNESEVALFVAPELPACLGDALLVNQLFSNLIGNAFKFLQPERPGVIRISGAVEGSRSVYCVADNGQGIDPAHQKNIFEVFHRLEPTKSKGEGLGLAIVQQITGRLGGEVWVESKPGEGSRFYVALPHVNGV